eukprot:GHVS01025396.1.p1 GENE.GHVS01025396.1~~GHVS01025396.1.p1  ORF type:complete len:552 (+),score=94.50 GHVS01025396.1:247-1902(+)
MTHNEATSSGGSDDPDLRVFSLPQICYLRFTVTSYTNQAYSLGVVGSLPALGSWNSLRCVPLIPFSPPVSPTDSLHVPTLWYADIPIELPQQSTSSTTAPNRGVVDFPSSIPSVSIEPCPDCDSPSSSPTFFSTDNYNPFFLSYLSSLSFQYKFVYWDNQGQPPTPFAPSFGHPPPIPNNITQEDLRRPPYSQLASSHHKLYGLYTPKRSLSFFLPSCLPLSPTSLSSPSASAAARTAGAPPKSAESVQWEGCGSSNNRVFEFDIENIVVVYIKSHHEAQQNGTVLPAVNSPLPSSYLLYLPSATSFIESGAWLSSATEYQQTTNYYHSIRDVAAMQYHRLCHNIYVGSTPRSAGHLHFLRDCLGITCVFNLQTFHDAINTSPLPPPPTIYPPNQDQRPAYAHDNPDGILEHMHALFEQHALQYVWLPTTDMSTSARAVAVPKAAILLRALLGGEEKVGGGEKRGMDEGEREQSVDGGTSPAETRDPVVYVHCNAGVGRSVGAACGYLSYVLRMPLRCTEYVVRSRRTVAYWDEVAMKHGLKDFDRMFLRV